MPIKKAAQRIQKFLQAAINLGFGIFQESEMDRMRNEAYIKYRMYEHYF